MSQVVTVHLFTTGPGSMLDNVFVVYYRDRIQNHTLYGLWSEHPALVTVLEILGDGDGSPRGTFRSFPELTEEEFENLVNKERLDPDYLKLKGITQL